mmetsp:Transcript_83306/g.179726  ORF Transcript_83306/g.179726 Transcript_83306/m.179726 type:complete len:278 (+) Transcript_83306:131-964(+)
MYKSYINSFYINQDNTVFTDNRIHKEVTNPQSISNDLHSNKIDKSQIKHTNNIHTHANPNANLSNLKVPNKSNISTLSSQKSNYFDLEAENNNDMVDTNSKTRPIDNVKNSNNLNSNSISNSKDNRTNRTNKIKNENEDGNTVKSKVQGNQIANADSINNNNNSMNNVPNVVSTQPTVSTGLYEKIREIMEHIVETKNFKVCLPNFVIKKNKSTGTSLIEVWFEHNGTTRKIHSAKHFKDITVANWSVIYTIYLDEMVKYCLVSDSEGIKLIYNYKI